MRLQIVYEILSRLLINKIKKAQRIRRKKQQQLLIKRLQTVCVWNECAMKRDCVAEGKSEHTQKKSIGAHMKCRDNDIRFVDVSLPFVCLFVCYSFAGVAFFFSLCFALCCFYLFSCAFVLIQTLRDNMHLIKSHTQCSCYVSCSFASAFSSSLFSTRATTTKK